ncbi:MAG: SOS response-associated peptidase [Alphaproteobacteria bacterium]
MCGRYSITTPVDALRRAFDIDERPNLAPRYNAAPTQSLPVVRRTRAGRHAIKLLRWGLVPSWAKEASIGARLINARAESVADKPAFRAAFRHRRCLVPADGFFEWQADPVSGRKQPFHIHAPDRGVFAFAGLWEEWRGPEGAIETFAIITTDANRRLGAIHDRMPVVLDGAAYRAWLAPDALAADLQALLVPAPDDTLIATPVSTRVNRVANDDPACIAPLAADGYDAGRTGQTLARDRRVRPGPEPDSDPGSEIV